MQVLVLQDDADVNASMQINLEHAVRVAQLLLPAHFTATELYRTVAGLSYCKPPRLGSKARLHAIT